MWVNKSVGDIMIMDDIVIEINSLSLGLRHLGPPL